MDDNTIANNAGLVLVVYLSVDNQTAGHGTHLRDLEYLLHLDLAGYNLLLHLIEHTLHR